jgi:hypothetical protein
MRSQNGLPDAGATVLRATRSKQVKDAASEVCSARERARTRTCVAYLRPERATNDRRACR